MSINEISNELILEIFDRVDDPGTLHQLSLCSKRMNDLANSIIYKSFKQRKNSDLPIFFKTILKHPHLAETVKQIDINIREMSLVWIEIENVSYRITLLQQLDPSLGDFWTFNFSQLSKYFQANVTVS